MRVEVAHRPSYARARVHLDPHESVSVEPGAMAAQTLGMRIESSLGSGGLFGAIKRGLGGESLFTSTFTAPATGGWVDIAPSYPGDISVMEVEPGSPIILTKGSWLASSPKVDIDGKFAGASMIFGGEGFTALRASGAGEVIIAAYGALDVHDLGPGQGFTVDTGHVVAYEESVQVSLRKAGTGLFNSLTSKEGVVMDFMGPGTVITQTRNPSGFASFIASLLPKSSNGSGGGGISFG